ncbi:MAG: hypothetical protein EPO65_13615 [Dehalococcoidia bacterium]|nr:MAG: hypothetical protein EPO65_13615 [Dehalococcoidia bacterium]
MTGAGLSVRLVERSISLDRDYQSDPASVTGSSWGASIPALHRVLANPTGNEAFPVPPIRPTDDDLFTHCDYWETALYLLTFLLGWSNPAAGLRWWYAEGRPTDDLRLAVLDRLWRFEGQLDLLAAWLLTLGGPSMGMMRIVPPTSSWPAGSVPREEIEALAKPFSTTGKPVWRGFSPYGEDYNGLHLGYSDAAGNSHGEAGLLLRGSEAERLAVLVLAGAPGWYYWLHKQGTELPDLGERSWHLDVMVRPIGWLGTFRKSRETGLWFQGKHSLHLRGNPAR